MKWGAYNWHATSRVNSCHKEKLVRDLASRGISLNEMPYDRILSEKESCPLKKGDWVYNKSVAILRVVMSEPIKVTRKDWKICHAQGYHLLRTCWKFDCLTMRNKKVSRKKMTFFHEDLLRFKILKTEELPQV